MGDHPAENAIVQAPPPLSAVASRAPMSLGGLLSSLARIGSKERRREEMCARLQSIRIKFVRLVHRLGQSTENGISAQVLYRFALAEQLKGGKIRNSTFEYDKTCALAMELEGCEKEKLDFCCTILLLGKSGVGKSATVNSILDKPIAETDAFHPSTKTVQVVSGTVKGINVKIIDTPGLSAFIGDRRHNERVVSLVKRCIRKTPPDIVLYVDRLDSQSKDFTLIRYLADKFGPAIWFNAILVLTHGSSAPPDATDGLPMNYDSYIALRTKIMQNTVRTAVGDHRIMNPVSLIENHPACRMNRDGERVLPNGMVWRPELMLLCFSARILAEANDILKLPESMPLKGLGARRSGSPMPVLLASLLQSRSEVQQPGEEEFGESNEDVESDEETEYDQLPPFRRLDENELADLDKKNRVLYFEELALREKLYKKKLWNVQCKRLKEMKMKAGTTEDNEDAERKRRGMLPGAAEPAIPVSFHSSDPAHRYRYIDDATWQVQPVTDGRGWDNENGFESAQMERSYVWRKKIPVTMAGQFKIDKKETIIIFDGSAAYKHAEDRITTGGLDIQTVGKDVCYNLWTGTTFKNHKRNKTMAGFGATMVGDQAVVGVRLEDKLVLNKRMKVVASIASSITRGQAAAYGGIVEATVVGPDYPAVRNSCALGLSLMNWTARGIALGANLHSQFRIGGTTLALRGNVNNRGTGQITLKANSSDNYQIALVALLPVARALARNTLFQFDS